MKLLVLSRYGRLGASSRLRMMQYLPYLAAQGVDVTLAPLFSDGYVAGLQHNRRNLREVLHAYRQRIKALWSSCRYDLIWIENEALPWLPAWVERALLAAFLSTPLSSNRSTRSSSALHGARQAAHCGGAGNWLWL